MANTQLVKVQQERLKFLVEKANSVIESQQVTLATQGIPAQTFAQGLSNAILTTPALAFCPPADVFKGVRLAIRDGIVPDGREGVLVPLQKYQDQGITKYKACTYFPMKEGLARSFCDATGAVFRAGCIRENDEVLELDIGIEPKIRIKPCLIGDPGKVVAAWAYVRLPNGEEYVRVFNEQDIKKARAASRANTGPWDVWYERMAEKSVGKSLLNSLRHMVPRKFVDVGGDGLVQDVGFGAMIEDDPEYADAVVIDGEAEEVQVEGATEPGEQGQAAAAAEAAAAQAKADEAKADPEAQEQPAPKRRRRRQQQTKDEPKEPEAPAPQGDSGGFDFEGLPPIGQQ